MQDEEISSNFVGLTVTNDSLSVTSDSYQCVSFKENCSKAQWDCCSVLASCCVYINFTTQCVIGIQLIQLNSTDFPCVLVTNAVLR